MSNPSILILPGDGIGPEVMAEVKKVITWYGAKRDLQFDVSDDLVGGAAYDAHGTPLHDDTMAKAQEVDAVLLGAVGGPKYDALDFSVKPERGLLRLRKEMDLFSNLRPAQCFDALADFSSLKKDVVAGLDIMIVRELTSGVYFGEPRGIFEEGNERVGINTQRYHHYLTRSWQHVLPHRNRFENLDRIATLLSNYDVVALQECDGGSLRSGHINQVQYLAEAAGIPY